jgi:transcriptional regulator with XRE-family HTH domain
MPGEAGDARHGRHSLWRYVTPLGDRGTFDAEFPRDPGSQPLVGGVAQQVHSIEDSGHFPTLSEAKPYDKPIMSTTAHNLFRTSKLSPWHAQPMTIGERIRAARLQAGFTQQYVARALGVNRSAVNQWESGTTKPSITSRAQLAVLLNLGISELIPGAPIDEITESLARIVRTLPPQKRIALVMAVEAMAKALDDPKSHNPISLEAPPQRHS